MEYQKVINLLDDTPNQPYKFTTKNWVEINGDSRAMYNTNSQIKFKISKLKSNLCAYNGAHIFVNGTITITGQGDDAAARKRDERKKEVVSKNCDYLREINTNYPS